MGRHARVDRGKRAGPVQGRLAAVQESPVAAGWRFCRVPAGFQQAINAARSRDGPHYVQMRKRHFPSAKALAPVWRQNRGENPA